MLLQQTQQIVDELMEARQALVTLYGRDRTDLERRLNRAMDQLIHLDTELQKARQGRHNAVAP